MFLLISAAMIFITKRDLGNELPQWIFADFLSLSILALNK